MKIFSNLLSLFLVFVTTSIFAQDEPPTVIDFTGEKPQVTIPDYDTLPEKFRSRVSRKEYALRNNIESRLSDASRFEMDKLETLNRFNNMFGTMSMFHSTFEKYDELPELLTSLELTKQQTNSLKDLRSKFEIQMKRLQSEGANDQKFSDLENEFLSRVREIFLPFQLLEIQRWNLHTGLPKLLTQTGYSDVVGLSQGQKDRIKEKSQKLAAEIEDFVQKKRIEAARLVADELNKEQKSKVIKIFGLKNINNLYQSAAIEGIFRFHDYSAGKSKGLSDKSIKIWDKN